MLISFIVPVYNAADFLRQTIESILNCGYSQTEIVLVDDGSSDSSPLICKEYTDKYPGKVLFFQHGASVNMGVSETRRLAISKSSGEFIFFLDADDCLLPGIIDIYTDVFSKNKDVVLIHGKINLVIDQPAPFDLEKAFDLGDVDKKYNLSTETYFLKDNCICNSTVCLRKNILEGVDFRYEQAFQVEDWVLWTLLSETGRFYYIARPTINYRLHSQSATYNVIKQGHIYYTYTKIELYMVLLAKVKGRSLKKKISNRLYEHLGMLYKFYSRGESGKLSYELINNTFVKDFIKSVIGKK